MLSGKLQKLPMTASPPPAAGETSAMVGHGGEMKTKTSGTSSVAAAFSSSSLSLGASVDTCPAMLQLSAPQLIARSPSLLKANRGMAEAAAIRGPLPPCAFTLRGTRPAREQAAATHDSNGGRRAAKASGSPRRPPYRVEIGQGYSPRLRLMGREDSTNNDGSKLDGSPAAAAETADSAVISLSQVLVQPGSPASRRGAGTTGTKDAVWGGASPASGFKPACLSHRTSQPRREQLTPWERDLQLDPSAETTGAPASAGRRSQARAKPQGSNFSQERPATSSRADGRLWMGTTAPKPEAARPRILFLVSGQQQQLEDPALRAKYRAKSRQQFFHTDPVVVPLPLPTRAGDNNTGSRVTLPLSKDESAVSCERHRGGAAGGGGARAVQVGANTEVREKAREDSISPESGRPGQGASSPGPRRARDHAESPPESRSGADSDGLCCDSATTAATDGKGKGGDYARRVLHIRVPHPPPTSLLILRSAPPTA